MCRDPAVASPGAVAAEVDDVGAVPAAAGRTVLPVMERVALPAAPFTEAIGTGKYQSPAGFLVHRPRSMHGPPGSPSLEAKYSNDTHLRGNFQPCALNQCKSHSGVAVAQM